MKEHRGAHRKKLGDKNSKAIKEWFDKNPDGMMKDCCEQLKLSHVTVRKHIKAIEVSP